MAQTWTDDVFDPNHDGQTDLQNIENNFAALKSQFGGASAPANPVAGMPWVDTTSHILKIRNEANSAWLSIFNLATGVPMGVSSDADTVDGIHAAATATANKLLACNGSAVMPCSITGSSASCTGNAATATTATTATTVAAASISQSKLKTASGEVSTTSASFVDFTLPGGAYGFYPRFKVLGGSTISAQLANTLDAGPSYVTGISFAVGSEGQTAFASQQYVQASPPYNLGDGEIPLFVFALVDKNGEVKAMYSAPEAPWHNNGPTSIRPDLYTPDGRRFKRLRKELSTELLFQNPGLETHHLQEITQAVKQADMALIPHPFMGNDLTGLTVVLIDPVSDHTWRAAELFGEAHDEHHDLYYKNKLIIDNAPLKRNGPPGVQVAGMKWKNSK
jgi:hypothetical protein